MGKSVAGPAPVGHTWQAGRSRLSCSLLTSSRHVCHREVKKPPDWAELTDGNRVFVGTRTGIEGAATEHMALSYSQVETLDCV